MSETAELIEDPGADFLSTDQRAQAHHLLKQVAPADPVIVHNDLRAFHILWDKGKPARMIDLSEAAIGQRYDDFLYLAADFGFKFARDILDAYRKIVTNLPSDGYIAMMMSGVLERIDTERWRGAGAAPRKVSSHLPATLVSLLELAEAERHRVRQDEPQG
jgi:aminoglycoside phosphotransferase (APT) family kinase protein